MATDMQKNPKSGGKQPTHNTLDATIRAQSIDILNAHLAAAIDLHAQMKQAHWNVRGPAFIAVHELFDTVSSNVEDYSDLIAERVGQLGGVANGTVQVSAKRSSLTPYPLGIADEMSHIEAVAEVLAGFGKLVHEAIMATTDAEDPTTADIFTEISRGIDKDLWFVESHIVFKG